MPIKHTERKQTCFRKYHTREDLIIAADAMHRIYPQYNGKWDHCVRVRLKESVRTKSGLAFIAGDVVLMHPDNGCTTPGFRMCYSYRTMIDTSVPSSAIDTVLAASDMGEPYEVIEHIAYHECDLCGVNDRVRKMPFVVSDDRQSVLCADCVEFKQGESNV